MTPPLSGGPAACEARTETVTRALRELVERDEIDRAFRRHGLVLSEIDLVFPDGAIPASRDE